MARLSRNVSRRGFIKGTAAAAGGAAALTALSSCSKKGDDDGTPPTVVDSSKATYVVGSGSITGSYTAADSTPQASGTWRLPLGATLRPSEGAWKPFVTPGKTATPMVRAGAVSISSGAVLTLVEKARAGGNYVILDARCSDSVFAWSEIDLVTRSWKLYAAPMTGSALGTVTSLWESDSAWDPPQFTCTSTSVLWYVMPSASGGHVTESSSCYLWKTGSTQATEVVRSPGHFACEPSVSDGVAVLVPRVRASAGRYYGITAYSLSDDLTTVIDQLVLPQSVAPMLATRIDDKFAFSIEANYSSGGLLGQMGTYIGNGSDPFVVVPLEPSADVSGSGGVYVVKTRSSHLVVNTNDKTYSTIAAPNRSVDYGDYPASVGKTSTLVTFATVKDGATGYPSSVTVRSFSL